MIKLPLPCSPGLWQAKTATEWERQMELARPTSRVSSLRSLRSAVELLLPAHCDHSRQRRRGTLQVFSSSAFTLQVLIHGLASAVFEHRFRGVDSGCAQGIHILKLRDFEEGLACWYDCFEHMSLDRSCTELARSSLITYHFVAILLRESLSDIQMAAGTAYSWGRVVTPQRAQEAFLPLVSTQPVGQEAYRHALQILGLCLDDDQGRTEKSHSQAQIPSRISLHPLHLTYNTFIAVLVLWAHTLGLSRLQSSRQLQHQPRHPIWVVEGGQLKIIEATARGSSDSNALENGDTGELGNILERGFARPEIDVQEIETIRGDVRRLMRIVRYRLSQSTWEICKSLFPSITQKMLIYGMH
jgi:hypothetical protein